MSNVINFLDAAIDPKAEALKSSVNSVLDSENQYAALDLMQYIDDSHLLKRLSQYVAASAHLPVNTVFMMGMSVFSSMAARKYCTHYEDGTRLPIGLYAVAEQPSGTGKSRCLNSFQNPFRKIHARIRTDHFKRLAELEGLEELDAAQAAELDDLKSKTDRICTDLFISNSTPEALDQILSNTSGFFSAVSSEQGLLNSLLGDPSKRGTNNNDSLLFGFEGGWPSNQRVSRRAYSGYVAGSICVFAQQGSIEKILDASGGTGVSERFIMLAEPHKLGGRDHAKKVYFDSDLYAAYEQKCEFIERIIDEPMRLDDLFLLRISDSGYQLINEYRNEIEPHLADGKKFSHVSLRGAAGKVDMQIMKIASNLQILDNGNPIISDKYIKAAISITHALLESNLKLCREKGLVGLKAEFQTVIAYLSSKHGARSGQEIINSLRNTQPFKSFTGNRPDAIRAALSEMVEQRLIELTVISGKPAYSML
jgi:hypothetical protein